MINRVLCTYAKQMERYMSSFLHQPEGLVEVDQIGSQTEEAPCKIQISLLSIERETAQGMMAGKVGNAGRFTAVSSPSIHVNLNVIIAAVFNEKRYKESLTAISLAITFLQSESYFSTDEGVRYTIEICNPSLQDQSNIWAMMGGKYYPSVFCKIRGLTFDSGEMRQTLASIEENKTNTYMQ